MSLMRSVLPAVIACLLLASLAADRASAETAPQSTPSPASPAGSAKAAAPAGNSTDSEAVARHAKRTACLKSAKDKKLVGAQKNAFVKDCIGAP